MAIPKLRCGICGASEHPTSAHIAMNEHDGRKAFEEILRFVGEELLAREDVMATKREIDIAKAAFAWPYKFDESGSAKEELFLKIIASVPQDLEAERKEFEKEYFSYISNVANEVKYNHKVGYYYGSVHACKVNDSWDVWKLARGIK